MPVGPTKTERYNVRRMVAEHGSVRWEPDTRDEAVLERLIQWKSAQYVRTGVKDLFSERLMAALLRGLLAEPGPDRGCLSAPWAGEDLVAAHMGIQSERVLHYWFPAYAPEAAGFSPGMQLLHLLLEAAVAEGFDSVEFGTGEQAYKQRLCNDETIVWRGQVEVRSWQAVARRGKASASSASRWLQDRRTRLPAQP